MAVREILLFPTDKAALRAKSDPVPKMNRQVQRVIKDLKDTLNACQGGVRLAGPPIALVNPEIIESGDEQKYFDGCLHRPLERIKAYEIRVWPRSFPPVRSIPGD